MTADEATTPPVELVEAIEAAPEAARAYAALPPSHRREYDRWIAEAKRPETRHRRARKTVGMLLAGNPGV